MHRRWIDQMCRPGFSEFRNAPSHPLQSRSSAKPSPHTPDDAYRPASLNLLFERALVVSVGMVLIGVSGPSKNRQKYPEAVSNPLSQRERGF